MALVSEEFAWGPGLTFPGSGLWAISTFALNDGVRTVAGVHKLRKTGSVNRVLINPSAKAGTSSSTIKFVIGAYTVDASGNPTTTLYGGSAATTVTHAAVATGLQEITLSTPASGVRGDLVAFVVKPEGVDPPTATSNVTMRSRYQSGNLVLPYEAEWATSWVKNATYPLVTGRYADDEFIGYQPSSAVISSGFASNTTPNEVGAQLTVPFGGRIVGMGGWRRPPLAGTGRISLYDASSVLQGSSAYVAGETAGPSTYGGHEVAFSPGYVVTAEQSLRITDLATSTDSRAHIEYALSSGALRGMFKQGARWQRTSRTNSSDTGAWTDDTTRLPMWYLLFDQIDLTGGGAGSGATGPIIWGDG